MTLLPFGASSVLGAGVPPYGGFPGQGGGGTEGEPETPPPPEPGQRYTRAVQTSIGTFDALQLEEMFRSSGADLDEPVVQGYLAKAKQDLRAAENQQEVTQVITSVQAYLPAIAQKYPSVPATAYSQALEASGFEGGVTQLGVTTPSELRGLNIPPHELVVGGRFAEQPDTGWLQYANGVLVDPSIPLGAAGGVYYKPGSTAPGSPSYLRNVQSWEPAQVSEWKKRLAEFGYLSKDQAKTKGVDTAFVDALRVYHETRYQNGGKPLASDLASAGGAEEYRLTAHDFQVEIRNDVRAQWQSSFGGMPSDAELEEWTRFVTKTSLRAQRKLEKRGVPSSTAAGIAAERAGQELLEEVTTSPEARFLAEQNEENTRLRDALESAVIVTNSLS